MFNHWTYGEVAVGADLAQGDIIQLTDGVRGVLGEAHNHFLDPKYSAFIILTQSCDLARRGTGLCKSRYINLAVIRPLEDILIPLLDQECEQAVIRGENISGIYLEESRFKADQFLSRIMNQNESSHGLFYLHADADVQIAVPSVALLQVSIALRREHYQILVDARSGRLTAEFQSRLGWIIGNLYSRVATRDWDKDKCKEVAAGILSAGSSDEKGPFWIPKSKMAAAKAAKVDVSGLNNREIAEKVHNCTPINHVEVAINRVMALTKEVLPAAEANKYEILRKHLLNDQYFKSAIK